MHRYLFKNYKRHLSKFRKFFRKQHFPVFLIFAVVLVVFVLAILGGRSFRRSFWPLYPSPNPVIPNIEKSVPRPPSNSSLPPNVLDPSLVFGTFFDTFSSQGYIDEGRTTMYQDKSAAAIFFRPDFSFESVNEITSEDQEYFKGIYFNSAAEAEAELVFDRRCLGDDCLEQNGLRLSYKGRDLKFPEELEDLNIAAISIGSLDKNFLVGFTIRLAGAENNDENKYQGFVFVFDRQKFIPLRLPTPLVSPYFGLFGFGGEEKDFLVIYGAYKGIAYRFRGERIDDISRFFDIRAMVGGFKAEIIKAGEGNKTIWYVFSSTAGRPWFIKLWQNRSPEIVGEAFFESLFFGGASSASFKLKEINDTQVAILANIKEKSQENYYIFTDRGFHNNYSGAVFFKPIFPSLQPAPITIEKLAIAKLDLDAGSAAAVKFLFSPDNEKWQEVPAGKNVDFAIPTLDQFFLQISFPPFSDKFYSPFLAAALFDYYYKK